MQYPQPNPPFPPSQSQVRERRKYGAIAALILSFFSGDLYRDVGKRWRGMGFWYLIFLLLVTWLPFAIQGHIGLNKFVREDAKAELEGFPTITIQDGKASIAEPEPYLWKDLHGGKVMLYVDTTGKFDLPEGKNAFAKLSKSKLEYKKNDVETQSFDLSQVKQFSLDKSIVLGWMEKFSRWTGAAIVLYGLTFALVYHFFQILIFAGIGSAIASSMNARLSYGAVMRLTAVALTPAMILSTVVGVFNIESCGIYVLYLIIEIVTLILAIKANGEVRGMPPGGFPAYPPGYGRGRAGRISAAAAGIWRGAPQQPGGYPLPPQQFPPGRLRCVNPDTRQGR